MALSTFEKVKLVRSKNPEMSLLEAKRRVEMDSLKKELMKSESIEQIKLATVNIVNYMENVINKK